MSRKIKVLALACVAVFALTAVSASNAFAASALTVGTGGTKIEGTQATTQKLILGAGGTTVKCTTSTLTAPVTAGTVTEATATPSYSGCTLAGLTATIAVNSCTYTITSTATALTANADVTNCASALVIKNTSCEVSIGNQNGLEKIVFANVAGSSPSHITATLQVKKIAYTGSAGCPANVAGSHTDGELEGSYTVKAFNSSGVQVALSAD